ncbi:GntR family transcriptional regulator [Pseudooceanicola nanhaiensis]|uniref:GntR family transcriptional regulator n=1 Tax=Pseudooceanicola nanhaiensis TaxID=375761 RepID=UPI001CD1BBCD|nr:GntR family transcriptional regulator [Pseudooceanicola nanhaiensis]MCA0920875.1 GntR family transcriptional regulator [Pseudooceanicola nanhaiensis]
MASVSRLHDDVFDGVLRLLREDGLQPGDRIVESRLADRLRVSRTPVRAVLDQLAGDGYLRRVKNRGVELIQLPEGPPEEPPAAREDDLLVRISHDRHRDILGQEITETEIMRRYEISRNEANRILERLAAYGVLERKLGYGWRFLDGIRDAQARRESYDFRMVIEPQMLLCPAFQLTPEWIAETRAQHRAFLESDWKQRDSIRLFEMDAAFHEGLALASGNRYFVDAVRRQNHMRRLLIYDRSDGFHGVARAVGEHLEVLDLLEREDNQIASILLYRHLERTRSTTTRLED